MSATETPPRGRKHRSAAMPPASASSQNPQNPHHLDQQAQTPQSATKVAQPGLAAQTTTPPRTPRRDNQRPSNTANTNGPDSASKQKSRNKNRPKDVMTSPAVTRNGRNISPPLTGAQSAGIPSAARPISTPSTAAYAGPTFHASPAPSALPIPSFYSKSVPDSPGIKGLRSVRESQVKKETSSPSTLFTPPSVTSRANQFQREESPLDIFFRADREEKARARSAISQTDAVANGPFQPPTESPQSSQTPPAIPMHSRPRHVSRVSGNGVFAMELDGEADPGTPYGSAFSTPYADRIHAARASSQLIQSVEQSWDSQQQPADRSEALKAYLFSGIVSDSAIPQGPPSASPFPPFTSTHQQPSPAHASGLRNSGLPARTQPNNHTLSDEQKSSNYVPRGYGKTSGLRQEVTPTKTPTRTPDRNSPYAQSPTVSRDFSTTTNMNSQYSPGPKSEVSGHSESKALDIQGMEESLRRILKLEPTGSAGITSGNVPAASASVPNYVGGRRPPMNGMHNGVMGS